VLGDDVARRSALDQADVGGRLLVDAAESEVGDGAGRGRDRRSALLRVHARVRRPAVERHLERRCPRCADDDLPDRRRLVVDKAELGLEPRVVEGVRAAQADLLLRREHEL
jgi:hypothetical protein